MGDTLKLNDTLRTLELEVGKMTQTGGMYSDDANARAFKETEIYKEMKVAHPTVKQNLVSAIMRWFRNDVSTKMATKIAEKYSDTIKDMQEQVTELNKMMTGSDSIAPKHEELVKYNQSLELTLETLKTCRSLERKITAIDKMVNKKTMEMFEGLDEDDDEADDAEVKLNTEVAAEVKTLKDAKKTMAAEQVKVTKAHHAKISNGLYSADDKGTVGKQFMPNCKVGTNSTTYISKMLYFVESQPQKFGWCLHEVRRILKDFNQRKGTHYQGKEADEVDEALREKYIVSNTALYKEFEISCSVQDFQAAHRTYTYGTNGGSKSHPWPCAEGNGLRILHFFVTRLVKVDCDHIESIEGNLMECPTLFGMGQPEEAVQKVQTILDEAERVDAQVGHRVVLRICDALAKRHPLFASLHSEKIKPSALTERRNARPELIRLMDEISTILLNIGDDRQHWKANQVNVELGINVYNTHLVKTEAVRNEGRGMREVNQVENKQAHNTSNQSNNKRPYEAGTGKPVCQFHDCTRPAFSHKKEHGGNLHGSKMCFDHFLLGVEDSKKSKPVGIPVKGGKTMIAKRGEDKKWAYKIFNIRLKIHDQVEQMRRSTFLKQIEDVDGERLLSALHNEFQNGGGKMGIYNTHTHADDGRGDIWDDLQAENEGHFTLPEMGEVDFGEPITVYDVKRHKHGSNHSAYSLYSDESSGGGRA